MQQTPPTTTTSASRQSQNNTSQQTDYLRISLPIQGHYLDEDGTYITETTLNTIIPYDADIPRSFWQVPFKESAQQHLIPMDILRGARSQFINNQDAQKRREQTLKAVETLKYSGSSKDNLASFVMTFQTMLNTIYTPVGLATLAMASCLTGAAKEAYIDWEQSLMEPPNQVDINHLPTNHIVAALATKFWTSNIRDEHIGNLSKTLKQKSDEKAQTFISRFKREVRGLDIPDHQLFTMLSKGLHVHSGAPTPHYNSTFATYCAILENWVVTADERSPSSMSTTLSTSNPFARVNAIETTTIPTPNPAISVPLEKLLTQVLEGQKALQQQQQEFIQTERAKQQMMAPPKPMAQSQTTWTKGQQSSFGSHKNKDSNHGQAPPRPVSKYDKDVTCTFCKKIGHSETACHRKYEQMCREKGWTPEPYQRPPRSSFPPRISNTVPVPTTPQKQVSISTTTTEVGTQGN